MTIPKIELLIGSKDTEDIVLTCTGCHEYYEYSVRQYKGDFGCNITEFDNFLNWAMWEAAKHECFSAGRGVYMPPEPERHEDPFGEEAMHARRETFERTFPGSLDFRRFYEMEPEEDEDIFAEDEEEPVLEFPLGFGDDVQGSVTGRLHSREPEMQDPNYIFGLRPMPREFKGKMVTTWMEFDCAESEQRILDEEMVKAGIYTRDARGNLRDEKGRCLACLRSGVHR